MANAGFIKVEDCIKSAMTDMGETNMAMYERYMSWALRGCNELTFDVTKNLKYVWLPVDSTTQTVKLPDDFVQYSRVGLRDQMNEIMYLTYDSNLAPQITTPNSDCHCSCGCTDPVCNAVTTNVTYSSEDIVINGTTYQKTTTICTSDNGNITQKICEPVVTNPQLTCNYQYGFVDAVTHVPFNNCSIIKNGISVFIGDIADQAALTVFFADEGFVLNTGSYVTLARTPTTYGAFTYRYGAATATVTPTQSGCTQPTPTIETVCHTENICEVETKPCGCVTVNDTLISTLNGLGNFWVELIQRWIQQADYVLPLKQPLSMFGYYNINLYQGIIQLDNNFQYDNIFLEYYSANEVTSKDYAILAQGEETLAAWIKWKAIQNKRNIPAIDKKMAEKNYYNEKRKLRTRLNPVRIYEALDILRSTPPIRP